MEQKSFPLVLWTKIWFSVYSSIFGMVKVTQQSQMHSVNSLNQDTICETVKIKCSSLSVLPYRPAVVLHLHFETLHNKIIKMLNLHCIALNRLKILKHHDLNFFSRHCAPMTSTSCFWVSISKKGKLNTHNSRNDQSAVNRGHCDSPFPLLSVLYLLAGPSGLHSECLGLSPRLPMTVIPVKGPPWPACLPPPPTAMLFGCLLCPDLIFTFRMSFPSIFFCTHPKFASKFYIWVYLSTFCSSFRISVSHQLRTTVLAIRLDNCNPKFFLGRTPIELIGFSGRLVLSQKGKFWPQGDYKFQFKKISSCSEAHSCDNIILCVSFPKFLS